MNLSLATGKQANNLDLTPYTPTFTELLTRLAAPAIGTKDGGYFTRCSGTKRTNNDTSDTASILIIDGDSRIDTETGETISGAVSGQAHINSIKYQWLMFLIVQMPIVDDKKQRGTGFETPSLTFQDTYRH